MKTKYLPIWPVLCAVLIVLKLIGKISIGWLWVFSPLWIPLAIALCIMGGIFFVWLFGVLLLALLALKK